KRRIRTRQFNEAKQLGRIIFISSESALQIPVEIIQYGMTKTAPLAISLDLTETTAVTVNPVLPGPRESSAALNRNRRARCQALAQGSRKFFASTTGGRTQGRASLIRSSRRVSRSCSKSAAE